MSGAEILAAVKASKGNITVAAEMLNVSVARLDRAVFIAKESRAIIREIRRKRRTDHTTWAPMEQIEEDIKRKEILYKHEAMDVLLEIALQPMSTNAYHNQIKMQAAIKLVELPGVKLDQAQSQEIVATLRAIDDQFRANAPRLLRVRETVREAVYEGGSVVDGESLRLPPD